MADAYAALREGGALVDPRREVVRATGPDATTFLQGQCSQDLLSVPEGTSTWSFILQPTGKVDALVRCTRTADGWLLDTDLGWADAVVARLSRFRLRTRVDLDAPGWRVVGVRGEAAAGLTGAAADWPGLSGVDLLGPGPQPPGGLPVASAAEWEAARIEAGIPVMGAELTERTIPGETGLVGRTVSFTKGCYTGQELTARIDSRGGHVPRHLVGLRSDAPLAAGTTLGGDLGSVTSAAVSPALGPVALAYVKRAVEVGAEVEADGAAATVAALPLVGG